jgi:hypothetical protein
MNKLPGDRAVGWFVVLVFGWLAWDGIYSTVSGYLTAEDFDRTEKIARADIVSRALESCVRTGFIRDGDRLVFCQAYRERGAHEEASR